mmetsp:Transcript_6480/g.24371  ORF Transcript_6480/g.24371 Transcript_6480/m.24371 type:complete len:139 (+) Transcript_6480:1666-2082(+)
MSLLFCDECNNMLYAREDVEQKRLKYVCKKCGSESYGAGDNKVYSNELKKTRQSLLESDRRQDWSEYAQDPTLPRSTSEKCPKCGFHEAVVLSEFGSEAKVMSVWFICANPERVADVHNASEDRTCSHRWKSSNRSVQ